jgi:hypothetical protein
VDAAAAVGEAGAADVLVVNPGSEAELVHEEHVPIALPAGTYEVRRQREYRPQRSVWVAD